MGTSKATTAEGHRVLQEAPTAPGFAIALLRLASGEYAVCRAARMDFIGPNAWRYVYLGYFGNEAEAREAANREWALDRTPA